MCAASSAPSAMPACCNLATDLQIDASISSVTSASGMSASLRPSTARVTKTAASGPAWPTSTSSGTRTPSRSARSRRYASCSTSCNRERNSVGPESRYITKRHALFTNWASRSSRPNTVTSSGPAGPSASSSVRPSVWSGARRTFSASTPSVARASATCWVVGRPPGEPNARCTALATVTPSANAPTMSDGVPMPRYIASTATIAMVTALNHREGRLRYGEAAATIAVMTARRTSGYSGPDPVRTTTSRDFGSASSPTNSTRPRPISQAANPASERARRDASAEPAGRPRPRVRAPTACRAGRWPCRSRPTSPGGC